MNFSGRKIEVSDLPELDSFQKSAVENSICASFDKLKRIVDNEILLNVHFKRHQVEGKRAKHSVHLKLSLPGRPVVASESGWNPVSVLQKALKVLEREVVKGVKRR
jgi:ribosome-associated translation inhibitor RaiA